MLTIGVMGAGGFIGTRLVETLHLEGTAQVRPIVRDFSSLARLARFALDWRVADALDVAAHRAAMQGCDIVIHAVAGALDVVEGTAQATYRAAEESGVRRIIYLSTASVHGQNPAPGTDESSPLSDQQSVPYNNAKVVAERRFLSARQNGSVELVILRPGIVIGPRDNWTHQIARSLIEDTAFLVEGGVGVCNTTSVDNLVHAIRLACTANDADGECLLIGDEATVTWRQLYEEIARAIGVSTEIPSIGYPPEFQTEFDIVARLRSFRAVRSALEYTPVPVKARVRGVLERLQV